jgi:flagellar biosynthesis/type III secretory pathway M-ring protein FliF/YscJ
MNLLRTLFILLLIYFIGRIVTRTLLREYVKNLSARAQQQEEIARQKKRKEKEGEVTIKYAPKPEKSFGREEGDYVDFEEIK